GDVAREAAARQPEDCRCHDGQDGQLRQNLEDAVAFQEDAAHDLEKVAQRVGSVMTWNTSGIVCTGYMKPDRIAVGRKKRNMVMNASCCVVETVEMNSPMPSAATM